MAKRRKSKRGPARKRASGPVGFRGIVRRKRQPLRGVVERTKAQLKLDALRSAAEFSDPADVAEFGPAAAEVHRKLTKSWRKYLPENAIDAGQACVGEVSNFVRSQGPLSDLNDWIGRMVCEVKWSNYMTDRESPDGRGDWQTGGGTSTGYAPWISVERQSADFWKDMSEGVRFRADGSQYRMFVTKVGAIARRK